MAQSKAKREAIAEITKDLRTRAGNIQYRLNDGRRNMKALAEVQAKLKRERAALFELVKKLEDGLLGPLGRWCPHCYNFGEPHHPNCQHFVAPAPKAEPRKENPK